MTLFEDQKSSCPDNFTFLADNFTLARTTVPDNSRTVPDNFTMLRKKQAASRATKRVSTDKAKPNRSGQLDGQSRTTRQRSSSPSGQFGSVYSPPVGGTYTARDVRRETRGFLLVFGVVGTPKPTPRPRASAGAKHHFTPDTAKPWRDAVRAAAKLELRRNPGLDRAVPGPGVPVRVDIEFRMPRPKKHFRTGRYAAQLRPCAPFWHTGTPDKDNLEKTILDALTGSKGRLPIPWSDDAQVASGLTQKRYADPGEDPGAWIVIYTL